MKHATIYFTNRNYYIHASSKTTAGVWIAVMPFIEISNIKRDMLGPEIIAVLKYSKENVPHPTDLKTDLLSELYTLANVKNWSAFFKSTRCLTVIQENEIFRITPNRKDSATRSFQEMSHQSICCSEKELDKEIVQVMQICE